MESAKKALTTPLPLYVAKTKSGLVMVGSTQSAVMTGATMAESKCKSCHTSVVFWDISFECLRWVNTLLAVCEYRSFAKLWQEKGCSSQAET